MVFLGGVCVWFVRFVGGSLCVCTYECCVVASLVVTLLLQSGELEN